MSPKSIMLGVWMMSFNIILISGGELLIWFQGTVTAVWGLATGCVWVWCGIKGDGNGITKPKYKITKVNPEGYAIEITEIEKEI